MLLETDNKPIAVEDLLKLYEEYNGNDEGIEHLDPMYHDAYKSLQQNHESFAVQYEQLLFDSLFEYTNAPLFDKNAVISVMKKAKKDISSRIILSSDPRKTADHMAKSIDQFVNGEDIDVTVPFILYMTKLYNHVSLHGQE